MSFTFGTLKTAIQDYTDNAEATFVTHLSDFIKTAEERIFTSVDLEFFRKNVTGTITSGNRFLAMPTDWLASFSLSIENSSNKEFLLQKDVNYLQEFHPNDWKLVFEYNLNKKLEIPLTFDIHNSNPKRAIKWKPVGFSK